MLVFCLSSTPTDTWEQPGVLHPTVAWQQPAVPDYKRGCLPPPPSLTPLLLHSYSLFFSVLAPFPIPFTAHGQLPLLSSPLLLSSNLSTWNHVVLVCSVLT